MTQPGTRAQRLAMPLARDVVRELAISHGGCVRPIQLRRTDLETGRTEPVLVPCGHTLTSVCPSCSERAKTLRAAQCREGWHLDREPIVQADDPDDEQRMWVELRSDVQRGRDQADASGQDTAEDEAVIGDMDEQIIRSGMRGNVLPARPVRRHRSTRRRQDTPDLPRRKITPRTIGKTYEAPDGKTFRPSMFITLTCPGYGRVGSDGTPADPARYDYQRAARDALHFAALFDRFIQNLRRFLGHDVQYFAAVEPQRRLAPHIHIAMRGTLSRTELRQVLAATYHQVWWPPTHTIKHHDTSLPVWHEASGNYLDPATGELLPAWDQALDTIGEADEPQHVARFGTRFDAQGVIAGSRDANRCIGYLTKYLTKHVADCHQARTPAQHEHAERLADTLRYEPCSPTCANWLRYGVQPKNPRPGLRPGHCQGKAHRLSPTFGNVDLRDVRESDIRRWRKERLATGSRQDRPFGPITVAKAYRLMHTVLNTAADDRLIRRNPCRIKGAGQEDSPERAVIPLTTLIELLDRVPPRYRALVLLATFASLRFGELAGLRRGQVDLDGCAVRIVVATAETDDGRLIDDDPKSQAGRRRVAFPKEIAPELHWHLERFAQPGDDGLVFIGPKAGRLRRSTFRRTWTKARAAVGLPDLHFHDLRHPGNTMAAGQGASLRELMERMGHSSARAALIYQHATQERDEAIAAGMGKLLRQARRKARTAAGGAGTESPSGTQRARGRKRAS